MKTLGLISVVLTGLLLLYAVEDFPALGDPHSPASQYRVSRHYIQETIHETEVPNMVTAVLADYRGYDTLFETVVIFTAGIAVLGILGRTRRFAGTEPKPVELTLADEDLIIRCAGRLLIPVIQMFALYVVAHGHHSPGGGFQGGVIFGSSLIILALARNLPAASARMPQRRAMQLACLGIFIYGGIAALCLCFGGNLLDYSALSRGLPFSPIGARYYGTFAVEIGVAFTVSAIMFSIYAQLSSRGKMSGGL